MTKGRDTRNWRKIKKAFRERAEAEGHACWLCRMPIDYELLDWNNDDVFEPDHLYSVSKYPERAEDPANLRASHRRCNRQRGNTLDRDGLGTPVYNWFQGNA